MDGIRPVIEQYFSSIITPFLMLGVGLATATLTILSLAAAVRGILMILENLLDEKATSALVAQLARGAAILLVLVVALGSWGAIQGFVLTVTSGATGAAASAMGISRPPVFSVPVGIDPPPQLIAQQVSSGVLFNSLEELMMLTYRVERLYKLRTLIAGVADATRQEPPSGVDLDLWIEQQIAELESREDSRSLMDQVTGYMSALIPAVQGQLIYLIAIISVLVFAVLAFYYLMGSLITILVALGIGPVAVAVAPIESAFARNMGGLLLSAAMQFAVVANLTVILSSAINGIAVFYLSNARLASGFGGTMVEMGASIFLVPMLCVVFALLVPKILGAITEIFSGGGSAKPGGVIKMALAATKVGALARMFGGGGGGGVASGVAKPVRLGGGSLPKT